jgi:tetratricopeptide (TPR) repeat protein
MIGPGRAGRWATARGLLRTSWRLAVCLLAAGCAYYNGMYNAKKWARQAQRSEERGRIAEARERWQRSALHAESVLARHPRSRWADDAMLLRGRALAHLELHTEAAAVLERAAAMAGEHEQRLEALLLLGRSQLALRRYLEARLALDEAAASLSAERRSAALLYRGRVRLAQGAPAAALSDFQASSHPAARFERARAALALRDTALALAVLDSLARAPRYVERDWLATLDSLAAAGASRSASALVDVLLERRDLGRGESARLLLGDGDRALTLGDTGLAAQRFHEAVRAAPDSAEARSAGVRLARQELRVASSLEQLADIRERLDDLAREGGQPAREAHQTLRLIGRVDSLAAAVISPDAFWYWRSELLRDSLEARSLAAASFAEMGGRFPDSPWTPKGLTAALEAGAEPADSLRQLLASRYADSPYVAALHGQVAEGYEALEDSLRQALRQSPTPARAAPGQRGAPPEGLDEAERIDRRRAQPGQQARPAQRPPRPVTPPTQPTPPPRPPPQPVRPPDPYR